MATSYPKGFRYSLQYTVGAAWNRLTSRAGNKYNHGRTYNNVEVRMTRKEFVVWATPAYAEWFEKYPDLHPSIDRIDPDGHYELSNIQIIPLEENMARSRWFKNRYAPPGLYWCGMCQQWLTVDKFTVDASQKSGVRPKCRDCQAIRRKELYIPHPLAWMNELDKRLTAPDGTAYCNTCKQYLPIALFHTSDWHKTGKAPKCRECVRESYRQRTGNTKRDTPRFRRPISPEGQNWCSQCHQHLPISQFAQCSTRSNGLMDACRVCHSRRRRNYPSRQHKSE